MENTSRVMVNLPGIVKSQISNWLFSPFIGLFMSIKSLKNWFAFERQSNEKLDSIELQNLYKYIDSAINRKIETNNENIESKFLLKFTQIFNEQLSKHKYQISDHDVDFIAQKMKNQLKGELYGMSESEQTIFINNVLLKNSNFLNEIEKIVALHRKSHYDPEIDNKFIDLDNKYKHVIDELYKFKLENDEKQKEFSNNIDLKLASFGETQFKKIDETVKETLVTILGFKTDGKPFNNDDIKSWIATMFVAKDYLETRLLAIKNNLTSEMKLELDKSSGFLMAEINDKIGKKIVQTIESSNQLNYGGSSTGSLSEVDIRRIVKEILAVYDADKTGIVDYGMQKHF